MVSRARLGRGGLCGRLGRHAEGLSVVFPKEQTPVFVRTDELLTLQGPLYTIRTPFREY